eukprot:TRINITY_DN15572_c0_g1_i1.p1 TRINITY_DN15572_c0_g1~~TRINITY_DN15572_c0_g1_i1.p1  ORF type:complete len:239 (-),score=50.53 TRINITY_DN15572_c0_g1_i1:120-809(-)
MEPEFESFPAPAAATPKVYEDFLSDLETIATPLIMNDDGWALESDKNGIRIEKRKDPSGRNKNMMFRCVAQINAPARQVYDAFMYRDYRMKWDTGLKTFHSYRVTNAPPNCVLFHSSSQPQAKGWISERDFVLFGRQTQLPGGGWLSCSASFDLFEKVIAAEKAAIRGCNYPSGLAVLAKGDAKSELRLVFNVDVKGSIPYFVLNMANGSVMTEICMRVRAYCAAKSDS